LIFGDISQNSSLLLFKTYFSQTTVAPAPPVVVQTVTTTNRTDGCREAIPALPMALAILICILNFLFPGLGE